jgi:hypothetical protein
MILQPMIHAFPLLNCVLVKLQKGILRITKEKWIDLLGAIITIGLGRALFNASTIWARMAVGAWILCFIVEVQLITAAYEVWHEINNKKSRPKHFRLKLIGIPILSLVPLVLVCFLVVWLAFASERTYVYLSPTEELMECERRAFFVNTAGPQVLHNVYVELIDDKSGKTVSETYQELDPGTQLVTKPLWFTPSSPWDEHYTATIVARESQSSQRLIVGSIKHELQLATQVNYNGWPELIVSCRDKYLIEPYKLVSGDQYSCNELLALEGDMPGRLDVSSYQTADGKLTIRRVKELPPPSVSDIASDDRHITEYQHQIIEPVLKKYRRSQIHIYYAGGERTKAYAEEFRKMFSDNGWAVSGPSPVPAGDERTIDIQLSVNYQENWNRFNPKSNDLMEAFKKAGIKRHSRIVVDPNVPRNWFVLWVGPRSPNAISPDQCLPAEIIPREGEHHTCEMSAQGNGDYCPIVLK